MALSGPEALRSLEEAVRDIRREEDEIAKRLARSGERVSKVREAEAKLFQQLAVLRLDPAIGAQIEGTLGQAELRARELLKAHAAEIAKTEARLKALDAELAALSDERAAAMAQIDTNQSELKALSAKIATAIAKDPDYEGRRRQAQELRQVAEESLRKTQQAEADRDLKGRPYRDDRLFMYLWERGYGTRTYKANTLEQTLDGWVARLIGFAKARPNFVMLNEIPLRLREHAERQGKLAEEAEASVDQLETQAIDAAGGKPVRDALATAQARVEAIDEKIVELEDTRDEGAKALRDLAQGRDPAFETAVNGLADSLGREDIRTLLADARRTQTGQDDTIVAQIDAARARLREEEEETRDHKDRLKILATRRRELEDIEWEFKKQRYDDPRSVFKEDRLVGDTLNDFLRGAITAAAYWEQWRRSQNWKPGTTDWGGGVGLPRGGRSNAPWAEGGGFTWPDQSIGGGSGSGNWGRLPGGGKTGGDFSRPRQGSSGNRKTGGFKTGGGF